MQRAAEKAAVSQPSRKSASSFRRGREAGAPPWGRSHGLRTILHHCQVTFAAALRAARTMISGVLKGESMQTRESRPVSRIGSPKSEVRGHRRGGAGRRGSMIRKPSRSQLRRTFIIVEGYSSGPAFPAIIGATRPAGGCRKPLAKNVKERQRG